MNKYRNVKTGVVVEIQGQASGDWELIPVSSSTIETPEETKPKKKKASKEK